MRGLFVDSRVLHPLTISILTISEGLGLRSVVRRHVQRGKLWVQRPAPLEGQQRLLAGDMLQSLVMGGQGRQLVLQMIKEC